MEIKAYVEWLTHLNHQLLESEGKHKTDTSVRTHYLFGYLEERQEWYDTTGTESEVVELGDIVAYLVLILWSFGTPISSICASLERIQDEGLPLKTITDSDVLQIAKRLFRGDYGDDYYQPLTTLVDDTNDFRQLTNGSFSEILETNYQKLTKRLATTGTLKGKGNNR